MVFSDTHWLQVKLDDFLQVNGEIPESIIQESAQMFGEKFSRFNQKKRGESDLPSLSQVGKAFCQLHAEKIGLPSLPRDTYFKLKMTYGDMTEVLALALLKAAGVHIFAINQKTSLATDEGTLYGEFDLIIQDDEGNLTLWDIKSASNFAFNNKFKSYQALKEEDSFGYVAQLFGYTRAERAKHHGIEAGGWIAVNKESGEIKICPADPADEDFYVGKITAVAKLYKEANSSNFARNFSDVEETWYKKPTGNRKLGKECTFCDFKYACWPELQHLRNPKSKSAWAYYTHFVPEESEQPDGSS